MRLIDRLQTVLLCIYPNIRIIEVPRGELSFIFEEAEYLCRESHIGSNKGKFSDVVCGLLKNIEEIQDEVALQLAVEILPEDFVTVVTHRGDLIYEGSTLFGTFSVTSIKSRTPTVEN